MALQSSGQISLSNIVSEKGGLLSDVSLNTLSTIGINQNSAVYPNGTQPHGISEFYGYDHNASPPASLSPITVSGPFENLEFACSAGPEFPAQQYYYQNAPNAVNPAFGPGSTLFLDDAGNDPVEGNTIWYILDDGASYQLDDGSTVAFGQLCLGGGGGKGGDFP
jgi:hypothetical protein